MTSSRPRVLLADDHAEVRAALERLLGTFCDVVGSVDSCARLLEAVEELRPDVVVTDLRFQDASGLDAVRTIRASLPHARIVVLSAVGDPAVESRALELGASAFVRKYRLADDLEAAILGDVCEE